MTPSREKEARSHEIDTEERETVASPTWCPERQIYVGGVVPECSDVELDSLLSSNGGFLRIFGYGSLCWNPGTGATLSKSDEGVTTTLGRAKGWKRCWAQRSADHRGTPEFPGLVCTLLSDEEVRIIERECRRFAKKPRGGEGDDDDDDDEGEAAAPPPSMTEGLIYTVPPALVEECLAELDFREKGGYARDVIDVAEDETGSSVKALLYRGTPDNPAFWVRALLDLPFAAATMAVSVGPSGPNDEYLYNLDTFLSDAERSSPAAKAAFENRTGDCDTRTLARMTRSLQRGGSSVRLHFLFGSGSNQHDQLRLSSSAKNGAARLVNGEDARELKEIVLAVPRRARRPPSSSSSGKEATTTDPSSSKPKRLFAGGGHSALLTDGGELYLWGWNGHGQLGRDDDEEEEVAGATSAGDEGSDDPPPSPLPVVEPLKGISVETAALGHGHTLVVERGTGKLFAFGDNGRGQADGGATSKNRIAKPATPTFVSDERFLDVAAGLFHSAAITTNGELVTFGCGRFGQCVDNHGDDAPGDGPSERSSGVVARGRWRPDDGSRLVRVACGRRHTVILDEHGRVWTMGDDKYGQLGRGGVGDGAKAEGRVDASAAPALVDGPLGEKGSGCRDVACGWSHNVALVVNGDGDDGTTVVVSALGWGRNDRGQLGTGSNEHVRSPTRTFRNLPGGGGGGSIRSICCGAESTMVAVGNDDSGGTTVWGCGWNEHGNLSIGVSDDASELVRIVGARIAAPPPPHSDGSSGEIAMAAGGAHFLAMMV